MPAVVAGCIEAVDPDRRVLLLGGREIFVPETVPFETWLREGVSVTVVFEERAGRCLASSVRRATG